MNNNAVYSANRKEKQMPVSICKSTKTRHSMAFWPVSIVLPYIPKGNIKLLHICFIHEFENVKLIVY